MTDLDDRQRIGAFLIDLRQYQVEYLERNRPSSRNEVCSYHELRRECIGLDPLNRRHVELSCFVNEGAEMLLEIASDDVPTGPSSRFCLGGYLQKGGGAVPDVARRHPKSDIWMHADY
mmetsp:Transcript_14344/g.30666  ORF Transcript_14344/g.30666 Transcript_14344/m.30666 type:complete len:118 (+) Transcript_14344:486-839(+)